LSAKLTLARGLSLLGHPLLVVPLAAMLAAASRGADAGVVRGLGLWLAVLALAVLGYSRWQVWRGHWAHVDASGRGERRDLNRALLALLVVAAAASAWAQGPGLLTRALALAAVMIVLAMLLARWLKVSLHAAFTTLAAWLPLWPTAVAGLLLLALAVAWSRLVLQRHRPAEVVAGVVLGSVAGAVLRIA